MNLKVTNSQSFAGKWSVVPVKSIERNGQILYDAEKTQIVGTSHLSDSSNAMVISSLCKGFNKKAIISAEDKLRTLNEILQRLGIDIEIKKPIVLKTSSDEYLTKFKAEIKPLESKVNDKHIYFDAAIE